MEISQQVKVTKADDDGGLDEKNVLKKMEVEPFADSLDLLPLEVEVEVCCCLPQILVIISISNNIHFHQHELMTK